MEATGGDASPWCRELLEGRSALSEDKAPPQDSLEPTSPLRGYFVLALRCCSRDCSRAKAACKSSVLAQPS
jgi:hypothetical protein